MLRISPQESWQRPHRIFEETANAKQKADIRGAQTRFSPCSPQKQHSSSGTGDSVPEGHPKGGTAAPRARGDPAAPPDPRWGRWPRHWWHRPRFFGCHRVPSTCSSTAREETGIKGRSKSREPGFQTRDIRIKGLLGSTLKRSFPSQAASLAVRALGGEDYVLWHFTPENQFSRQLTNLLSYLGGQESTRTRMRSAVVLSLEK